MLGQLPQSLDVCGKDYAIRADYRNILRIFSAFNDPDLSDSEKVYVCLKRLYADFETMPRQAYGEAYKAATAFMECNFHSEKNDPKTVNWEKDEQLIFPAINKVAGTEVRAVSFLHWWTFLGYFQNIDHEDLWGFVLTLRQKRARGKKLEKHEREFWRANREICEVKETAASKARSPEDMLHDMFNSLAAEGGDE